jgi:hypothetical protein
MGHHNVTHVLRACRGHTVRVALVYSLTQVVRPVLSAELVAALEAIGCRAAFSFELRVANLAVALVMFAQGGIHV